MNRAPTVNDLRVKLCYICREEEVHDQPVETPRRWVHPCNCTLIAHEQCLLEWIRASETNPDKSPSGILKCPQCGSKYELDSKTPFVLRVMDNANSLITTSSHAISLMTIGSIVVSAGAGVYLLLTSYGAFALRHFVGDEVFNLILGDDPTNWSLYAYLNLPMIPLSLLMSRTRMFRSSLPFVPTMVAWATMAPIVGERSTGFRSLLPSFGFSSFEQKLRGAQHASVSGILSSTVSDVLFSWPPSPFLMNFIFPTVQAYYRLYRARLRRHVLGNDEGSHQRAEARRGGLGGIIGQGWRLGVEMNVNVQVNGQDVVGNDPDGQQRDGPAPIANPVNEPDVPIREDNDVRLVLDDARNDNPEAIQAGGAPQEGNGPRRPDRDAHRRQLINRLQNRINERQQALRQAQRQQGQNEGGQEQGREPAPVRVTGGLLGRWLGGALLTPPIASIMGSFLLRLALPRGPNAHKMVNFGAYHPYSPRQLLCRFLAIRPPGSVSLRNKYIRIPSDASDWQKVGIMLSVMTKRLTVGSQIWTEADPVWWRNMVGYGIYTVLKDSVSLWYQYLSQREIKSRRLLDRPFTDVDPSTLELISVA